MVMEAERGSGLKNGDDGQGEMRKKGKVREEVGIK